MRSTSLSEELGRRVRAAREAAGLGVGDLAREAGLSRRYVTETEAGRANPSLSVLARLADALGVALPALLDFAPRARAPERIALVGLRGAGKSTVGRALALHLEVPFLELDREVERLAGLSLGELFEWHGADAFHRFEGEALERLLASGERVVLAAGGSIIEDAANWSRLLESSRTVWLRATPEEHMARVVGQGDERPMRDRPRALAELEALLERRRAQYERCDITIETSGRTPSEVVRAIVNRLQGFARAAEDV